MKEINFEEFNVFSGVCHAPDNIESVEYQDNHWIQASKKDIPFPRNSIFGLALVWGVKIKDFNIEENFLGFSANFIASSKIKKGLNGFKKDVEALLEGKSIYR